MFHWEASVCVLVLHDSSRWNTSLTHAEVSSQRLSLLLISLYQFTLNIRSNIYSDKTTETQQKQVIVLESRLWLHIRHCCHRDLNILDLFSRWGLISVSVLVCGPWPVSAGAVPWSWATWQGADILWHHWWRGSMSVWGNCGPTH